MTRAQNLKNFWKGMIFLRGSIATGGLLFVAVTYFSESLFGSPEILIALTVIFGIFAFGTFTFLVLLWLIPKALTSNINATGGLENLGDNWNLSPLVELFYIKDV